MGATYLIDTNAISDYMAEKLPIAGLIFMDDVVNLHPTISVMTRIELMGQNRVNATKFLPFINVAEIHALEESIILQTIALRRARRIKIPDAVIAATALVYDLTLITHNTSDFEGIPSLRLIDPHLLV